MPNIPILPQPPVNSTGQPGQAAYLKTAQTNAKLTALTLKTLKGGSVVVPAVQGTSGSAATIEKAYQVAGQQHANRKFDGGRRQSKRKTRKNRKSRKYRKKNRR